MCNDPKGQPDQHSDNVWLTNQTDKVGSKQREKKRIVGIYASLYNHL